jgi:hypothetical protein
MLRNDVMVTGLRAAARGEVSMGAWALYRTCEKDAGAVVAVEGRRHQEALARDNSPAMLLVHGRFSICSEVASPPTARWRLIFFLCVFQKRGFCSFEVI